MAEYVYPALFHPNDDGSYTITFPDLTGCISEGKSLPNAMYMAQDALTQWLSVAIEIGIEIPSASKLRDIDSEDEEFTSLIRADIRDNRAVRKTVSIPKWMDDKASAAGISLSRVLQGALAQQFDTLRI